MLEPNELEKTRTDELLALQQQSSGSLATLSSKLETQLLMLPFSPVQKASNPKLPYQVTKMSSDPSNKASYDKRRSGQKQGEMIAKNNHKSSTSTGVNSKEAGNSDHRATQKAKNISSQPSQRGSNSQKMSHRSLASGNRNCSNFKDVAEKRGSPVKLSTRSSPKRSYKKS